jgi:cyclopropane fatty-acyl-phospholipid synthase-like methyltransferase
MRLAVVPIVFATALAVASSSTVAARQTVQKPVRAPDIHWVPTPDHVVDGMLKLAKVGPTDLVYDLGCGDGKIVIAAAKLGARGVGVDIDPQRIKEANANAEKAGVTDKVKFILGDIFDPNIKISDATVVTLYLLPSLNGKLQPRLQSELKPGTRVVSHAFHGMTNWEPERTEQVNGTTVHLWTIGTR